MRTVSETSFGDLGNGCKGVGPAVGSGADVVVGGVVAAATGGSGVAVASFST